MKCKNLITVFIILFCLPLMLNGQVIVQSTAHFEPSDDFSMEDWLKTESQFHENVIMKNEFIKEASVFYHYYTADNSEIVFMTIYDSWEDIPKADEKNQELAKAAWSDEAERKAFFKKQLSYYTMMHSDEIYSQMPNSKSLTTKPDSSLIYYMVKRRVARMPEDGSMKEAMELMKEFTENIIHKNESVLAYYPMRHQYGSDSRDFAELIVLKSLVDLEEMVKNEQKLVKEYWPDEEERKAFFDKMNKYFENWHGDAIYTNVAELSK